MRVWGLRAARCLADGAWKQGRNREIQEIWAGLADGGVLREVLDAHVDGEVGGDALLRVDLEDVPPLGEARALRVRLVRARARVRARVSVRVRVSERVRVRVRVGVRESVRVSVVSD